MTTEMQMLAFSILLGIVQLVIAVCAAIQQRGFSWAVKSRDEKVPELTGVGGRLERAFKNFLETFGFFVAAIVLAMNTKSVSPHVACGAQLYFYSRVLYVPIYALGLPFLRTIVWTASIAGIVCIVLSAF